MAVHDENPLRLEAEETNRGLRTASDCSFSGVWCQPGRRAPLGCVDDAPALFVGKLVGPDRGGDIVADVGQPLGDDGTVGGS
jgi:hypothetical protein